MTETSATYSADVTVDRIMPYVDGTTGRTAGGSAAQINTFQAGPMGRVMVGLTDDAYVRNEVATGAGELTESPLAARSDVAIVDIAALRTQQMDLSLKNLDQEAGLLYYFWSRENRFPASQAEYKAQINARSGLRDFWGQDFTYTAVDANNGGLAFTTPWGEARSISVTMAVATTSSSTPPLGSCTSVGQSANGGQCVTTGANAIIAAPSDVPPLAVGFAGSLLTRRWGSLGPFRGATSPTNGQGNTAILAAYGESAHPAAYACANLTLGGFDDWYLPAIDELNQLYQARAEIGGFSTVLGVGLPYWSSTEYNANIAWVQHFVEPGFYSWWDFWGPNTGYREMYSKHLTSNIGIRCVRRAD